MWNKLDFEGVLQNFCSEWYKTNQTKHSDLNVPGQILIEVNSVLLKKKIFPGSLRLTSIVCQHNYLFSFTVINIRTGNSFRIQTNLAIFYSRIEFAIRFVLLLSRRSCLSVGVYRTVSQSNMFPTISIAYWSTTAVSRFTMTEINFSFVDRYVLYLTILLLSHDAVSFSLVSIFHLHSFIRKALAIEIKKSKVLLVLWKRRLDTNLEGTERQDKISR